MNVDRKKIPLFMPRSFPGYGRCHYTSVSFRSRNVWPCVCLPSPLRLIRITRPGFGADTDSKVKIDSFLVSWGAVVVQWKHEQCLILTICPTSNLMI